MVHYYFYLTSADQNSWLFFSFFSSLALGTVGRDTLRTGNERSLRVTGGDSGERGLQSFRKSFGASRDHVPPETSFACGELGGAGSVLSMAFLNDGKESHQRLCVT